MFNIDKAAEKALFLLLESGYEAYLVGGCVRDSILGRSFTDYDITTNALPYEIKEVFCGYKTLDVGIKHGTVTVIIDKLPIEITTYRIDGEYTDNRHPDKVEFSGNIRDDLSRRDFTMNAVCYNGGYIDPFGGIEDINRRIIKCIGDPVKRFTEDSLRILRALRFSACLGFEIDPVTSDAIRSSFSLLANVSEERICAELKKLLCGENASDVIVKYHEIFESIFESEIDDERVSLIKNCPLDFDIRLAWMLLDNERHNDVLKKLKLDKKSRKRIALAIEKYNTEISDDSVSIKKYISKYSVQSLNDLLALKNVGGEDVCHLQDLLNDVLEKKECFSVKELCVNGDDLISLGVKGKEIGDALGVILKGVIEGRIDNKKEDIIDFVKEKMRK